MGKHRGTRRHRAMSGRSESSTLSRATAFARTAHFVIAMHRRAHRPAPAPGYSHVVLLATVCRAHRPLAHTINVLDALHSVRQRPVVA